MQIAPPRFCHVSKSHTPECLHYNAVKCSKKPYPIILTEYSLFSKSTSSMSTKSPLQAENSTFFWLGHGQNVLLRIHHNTPFQVKNSFFSGASPHPAPNKPSGSALHPQNSSQIYATEHMLICTMAIKVCVCVCVCAHEHAVIVESC